jgi:hypothetical protein
MLTYCYPAWPAVPYLYIGGPMESGKTRVFEVLEQLVFRPLCSSNMTAPTMFRTLHDRGGTLLLDEAERLKQSSDPSTGELMSMLLAGYKRGGQAMRMEAVGDTFQTRTFQVFGPKALACIAGLPPALASRCITITMFRAAPNSEKPRRRVAVYPWQPLRDQLHVLALEHGPEWLALADRTDVCPTMSGRNYELWQPLLALAAWIEQHDELGLLKLVQDYAQSSIDAGRDDKTPFEDEILLRLLADALRLGERPRASDLLTQARVRDPDYFEPWTARGVSARLKRYGLETRKSDGDKVYGPWLLEVLRRVETSYGMDLGLSEQAP